MDISTQKSGGENENDVACSAITTRHGIELRNRSGTGNSKRVDAASLAIKLATTRLWSDDTSTQAPTVLSDQSSNHINYLSIPHPNEVRESHIIELDPPPEYTEYQDRDNDTDSDSTDDEMMHRGPDSPEMAETPHLSHGDIPQQSHEGARGPLLQESDEKSPWRTHPWANQQSASTSRRKRWFIVLALALLWAFGNVLVHFIVPHTPSSSKQSLPHIPTDRNHVQHERYKDIIGSFELRDILDLSTTTGNINIEIDPQPISPDSDPSSQLILSSSTGTITVSLADTWWKRQNRTMKPIDTTIKSITGSINARILLGSGGHANISSISGPQELRIHVHDVTTSDPVSRLTTTSHIGGQTVMLTHFGPWDTTIDHLEAEHRSLGTANLNLQYSKHWRGRVYARSSPVGHVNVDGDVGLVVEKQTENEVIARKGRGDDLRSINAISEGTGSVNFASWYTR